MTDRAHTRRAELILTVAPAAAVLFMPAVPCWAYTGPGPYVSAEVDMPEGRGTCG